VSNVPVWRAFELDNAPTSREGKGKPPAQSNSVWDKGVRTANLGEWAPQTVNSIIEKKACSEKRASRVKGGGEGEDSIDSRRF